MSTLKGKELVRRLCWLVTQDEENFKLQLEKAGFSRINYTCTEAACIILACELRTGLNFSLQDIHAGKLKDHLIPADYNLDKRLPELRAQHDQAIMRAYVSKDLEVEQLKADAQQQWEEWKHEAAPDLVLLVQADIHSSSSEKRVGKDTLVATQASILEATGGLILSDDARQTLVLSALRDLQLANEIEGRAIRLRQEALSRVILSLSGTEATGIVRFLIDSFGGAEEYEKAKAELLAHAPAPEDLEQGLLDEDEEETGAVPKSSTEGDKYPDICVLKDAKLAFSADSDSLSSTGVPEEFILDNRPTGPTRQSAYHCLYGGCNFVGKQKASAHAHIHRKHLGVAIACPHCSRAWWTSNPFIPHMEKIHKNLESSQWWTALPSASEWEEKEATEALSERQAHGLLV